MIRLPFIFAVFMTCAMQLQAQTYQARYSMMTGVIDAQEMLQKNMAMRNYKSAHESTLQPAHVEQLKAVSEETTILVFLGTWCPDSQRNVPPFMNLIEAAQNELIKVEYIGVNRRKRDPDNRVKDYEIRRVPTFVVMQQGQEIGRLVERPKTTVEEDILAIFVDKSN